MSENPHSPPFKKEFSNDQDPAKAVIQPPVKIINMHRKVRCKMQQIRSAGCLSNRQLSYLVCVS